MELSPATVSLLISGATGLVTATAAFVGVKVGLNGLKSDIKETKRKVNTLYEQAYNHESRISTIEGGQS